MKPLHAIIAAAALAGAAGAGAGAAAQYGPGAGEACWLQADTGRAITALSAHVAPGVTGDWTLSVRHRDGVSFDSDQSGHVRAGAGAERLARLVISQGFAPPPRVDYRARMPVPARPGTTVIASDYTPAPGEALPVEAELNVYDPRGRLICRARDIWLREGY